MIKGDNIAYQGRNVASLSDEEIESVKQKITELFNDWSADPKQLVTRI